MHLGTSHRWIEQILPHTQRATFGIEVDGGCPSEEELRRKLEAAGLSIVGSRAAFGAERHREFVFDLRETRTPGAGVVPLFVEAIASQAGVVKLRWHAPA